MSKRQERTGERFDFFRVRPAGDGRRYQVVSVDYDTQQGVFVSEMTYRQAAINMAQRLDEWVKSLACENFAAGRADACRDINKLSIGLLKEACDNAGHKFPKIDLLTDIMRAGEE